MFHWLAATAAADETVPLPEVPAMEAYWPSGEPWIGSPTVLLMKNQLAAYERARAADDPEVRDALLRGVVEAVYLPEMQMEKKFIPFWMARGYAGLALNDFPAVHEAAFHLIWIGGAVSRPEAWKTGQKFRQWTADRTDWRLLQAVGREDVESFGEDDLVERGFEVALVLIEQGMNPNDPFGVNFEGRSPLQEAIGSRDVEVVRLLLENGADPNHRSYASPVLGAISQHTDPVVFDLLVEHGLDFAWWDPVDGGNLLFHAHGLTAAQLEVLLDRGVSVHHQNIFGETPLHALTLTRMDKDILELLLEAGADPNNVDHLGNRFWNYRYAVGMLTPETLSLLLRFGADMNARDEKGRGIVHKLAEMHGVLDLWELLRDHGVDLNPKDAEGLTPLHLALAAGVEENVDWLLEVLLNPHTVSLPCAP